MKLSIKRLLIGMLVISVLAIGFLIVHSTTSAIHISALHYGGGSLWVHS